MTRTRPVVSTRQMIPSIRHQGYHITYALAELIDNAIQANAKNIEILCMEKVNTDTGRKEIESIAVLDDGHGMTREELWDSIRLGQSQNRGKGGIGKFGVGLTHATFSQCENLKVYSWKNSNAYCVHLDIGSVDDKDTTPLSVEEPTLNKIPDPWKKISKHMSKSGTLVIWSKLDRVRWKKADTLIKHSEFTLGRIYRKFIHKNKLQIHMISFDSRSGKTNLEKLICPNDPLYLMENTSTPPPWNNEPMFERDGPKWEEVTPIFINDEKHDVITRYSFAKTAARDNKRNPGTEPYGKHASNNLGISVIRADREITLDTHMITSYDPTERWWGAEIDFPPALDAIFGVGSNKQTASELAYVMELIGKQNRESRNKEDLEGEDENPLFDLVSRISERIASLRSIVKKQRTKLTTSGSDDPIKVPKDPEPTVTDKQLENMSEEERKHALEILLKRIGSNDPISNVMDSELKIEHVAMTGSQFFDVSLVGGVMVISINTNHKAYTYLLALLLNPEERDKTKSAELLEKSAQGFKKFLASWASLENKIHHPGERKELADIRYEWGKKLDKYFEINNE